MDGSVDVHGGGEEGRAGGIGMEESRRCGRIRIDGNRTVWEAVDKRMAHFNQVLFARVGCVSCQEVIMGVGGGIWSGLREVDKSAQ